MMHRSSYQALPSLASRLAPILELHTNDPHTHGLRQCATPRAESPVLRWSDDGGLSSSSRSYDGARFSPSSSRTPHHPHGQLPSSQQEIQPQPDSRKASSILPAVWRSIGGVVSQMKAMRQQIWVSSAILKVMSAISVEVADVQEARRKIKKDLAKENHKLEAELEASVARVQLDNRLHGLRQQVVALQELLASGSILSEQEVLHILSQLKVSRIRTMAAAALSYNRQKPKADKGIRTPVVKSALGLPSLLRRKSANVENVADTERPTEESVVDSPQHTSADLEQIMARASRYSSGFSAFASRRQASLIQKQPVAKRAAPIGIPSLPRRQPEMKPKGAISSAIERGIVFAASHMPPELHEQVLARALQYSGSFSAIALRHASRQASFLQQTAVRVAAPIGIPSLPKKRKMRQRAQSQVDEAAWKASCSVLV